MTDEEKKKDDPFFEIDEKNKRITYYPRKHIDGCVEESAECMSEIAKQTGYEVEATFNGIKFSVAPGMSPKDAFKVWEKNMLRADEEYKKSPQYAAKRVLNKIDEQKQKEQIAKDNILIANEKLELTCPNVFAQGKKRGTNDFNKDVIEFAERWARLMQAEMKKQKTDHLTEEIIQDTSTRADLPYGMASGYACSQDLLIRTWKYGDELGQKLGQDMSKTKEIRSRAQKQEADLVAQKAQTMSATNLKSGKSNDR